MPRCSRPSYCKREAKNLAAQREDKEIYSTGKQKENSAIAKTVATGGFSNAMRSGQ
jgi:hypothetical protein